MSEMVTKFDATTGDPIRRKHNSLVYSYQYNNTTTPIAPSNKVSKATTISTPSNLDHIISSNLTVEEKHIWMLTMLLVHHVDQVLNNLFSTNLINKKTPEKFMRDTDQLPFNDIGHMMELKLYGWVISHAYNDILPAPYAIQEILGSTHTAPNMPKQIMTPSIQMRALLANPDDLTIAITADMLAATVTGNGYYQQNSKVVELGGHHSTSIIDDVMMDILPAALKEELSGSKYKNMMDSWKA